MKRIFVAVALIALTAPLLGGNPARAASISDRQAFQQQRIREGLANGTLTHREAQSLEREQGKIEGYKRHAWADDRLQPWERDRLEGLLNQADAHIRGLKHNGRNR